MRIFRGTSYTSQVDDSGKVDREFRTLIEEIIGALESQGHSVHCALKADNWVLNEVQPDVAVPQDLQNLGASDVFLAFVKIDPPSAGVQLEIGFALAKEVRIVLLRHEQDKLAYLNRGLVMSGQVEEVTYSGESDLPSKLSAMFWS